MTYFDGQNVLTEETIHLGLYLYRHLLHVHHSARSSFLKHLNTIPTVRANLTMTYVYDQTLRQRFGLL